MATAPTTAPEQTASGHEADSRQGTSAVGIARALARNSIAGIASFFALKVLSFAYSVAIIRQLGEEDFGRYSTVAALIALSTVFAEFGTGQFVSRAIALDRSHVGGLFGNLVAMRLVLSALVLMMNMGVATLLGYESSVVGWVALSSLAFLLYAVQGPCVAVLRGFERLDYTTSFNVIYQFVLIASGATLLWLGWGVTGVILAGSAGVVVTGVLAWRAAAKMTPLTFAVDFSRWWPLLVGGLPFALTILATNVSFRVDTLILSYWRPNAEIGWYNVGYGLALSLVQAFTSTTVSFIPTLSRLRLVDREAVDSFVARVLEIGWALTLPIAVQISVFAQPLIVLLYGERYAPVADVLRIIIWVVPILTLTSLLGSFTTVLHLERDVARLNVVNALTNVGLNLLLIPVYGVIAAATMTVLTELLCLGQYALLMRDRLRVSSLAGRVASPVFGVAIMAGVLVTGHDLNMLMLASIGGLVYALAAIGAASLLMPTFRSHLARLPRRLAGT